MLVDLYGPGVSPGNVLSRTDLQRMGLLNEVERVYRKIGGILEEVPLSFGKWDIVLKDFIIELDEEQHFNRYRATTLDSFIYHVYKGMDYVDYRNFCIAYEPECQSKASWGKYWANDSTEMQFGVSGITGDLDKEGSSRWKQRAYYDYLRDVFSITSNSKLIRISVYDKLICCGRIRNLGEVLMENSPAYLQEITKFIDQKLKSA